MISDKFGNTLYQKADLFELLYKNCTDLKEVIVEPCSEIEQFEQFSGITLNKINNGLYGISVEEFDQACQDDWYIPDEYKNLDIEKLLYQKCPPENHQRVSEELAAFKEKNLIPLLKVLLYLVDTFRKHNVLWGVGRGSSVASYVLFLLDVHRIDSVKYNLDWQEFLR
jgi:DNA polymerase III alpha subunit